MQEVSMKKLALIFVVLLFAGCATVAPERKDLFSKIKIIRWWPLQNRPVSELWAVRIDYEVKNTRNVPILYYQVRIEITFEDGSKLTYRPTGPRNPLTQAEQNPIAGGEARRQLFWTKYSLNAKPIAVRIIDWKFRY
jgi:hypothetical protein